MIVTADIHLTEDTEGIVFEEVLPGLVESGLARGSVPEIAILGDIYHIRYQVSVRLQNRLYNFFENNLDVFWTLLPGNHDQINRIGEHALEVFRDAPNVTVISEPTWRNSGLWIPYRKDPADIERALALPLPSDSSCAPVVWMHHGVRGALMNSAIRDVDGIPMESFDGFERVFCGHYHLPQDLGFLEYIGSPYQTRADESGQAKRIGIWDHRTNTMSYVPVNWGRRFFRIESTTEGISLPDGMKTTDEIRVKAAPGVDVTAQAKHLESLGYENVVITQVQEAAQARLQVDPSKGLPAYVQSYLDQFAGELDNGQLMQLYEEITR